MVRDLNQVSLHCEARYLPWSYSNRLHKNKFAIISEQKVKIKIPLPRNF